MFFKSLQVYQFRNLKSQKVPLSPGTNIFVGKNGQGKTNFIEAMIYLASGKSFRPHHVEHLLSWDHVEKAVYIGAKLEKETGEDEIEYRYQGKSQVSKNGKKFSWSKLVKEMPCVLFSPESLNSIKSGPNERRELIDESLQVLNPNSAIVIKNFHKVLRSRNRILSDFKKEKIGKSEAERLIDSINNSFLEAASELVYLRLNLLKNIAPLFQEVARDIMGEDNVEICVDYVASKQVINNWSEEKILDYLQNRMQELRMAEFAYGTTLVGPHKHDIYFLYQGHDSRYYCSQGQQRALILSFKMAKIMYYRQANGHWPFLFLDDVLSELDADKRDHLISFLKKSEGQTFITTTDLSFSQDLSEEGAKIFNVELGLIKPS